MFRYILAEPDDHGPFRKEFDDSNDLCGKQIPGWLSRKLMPDRIVLSMHDRAPQLKLFEDRRTVIGEKGYSSIRANLGVSHGSWYYEVKINDTPGNSACRIGWGQELANLQAPLGYDKFGYSCRSRKGTKFHESIGKHYASGYSAGDVLGCLIELPDFKEKQKWNLANDTNPDKPKSLLPPTYKDKPLIKFKAYLYFEEKDEPAKMAKQLQVLPNSRISFFKNGNHLGTAFENVYDGFYYPAAGLYKNISLTFNFGPDFECPPQNFDREFRPMSDAVLQSQVEQTLSEIIYFVENEGKISLEKFFQS